VVREREKKGPRAAGPGWGKKRKRAARGGKELAPRVRGEWADVAHVGGRGVKEGKKWAAVGKVGLLAGLLFFFLFLLFFSFLN
jgi:hypothetical protein